METDSDMLQFHQNLVGFQDQRFYLYQLSQGWQVATWILMTGSLAIGSMAKFAVYSHIASVRMSEQPINVLILQEQIISHVINVFILVSLIIPMTLGLSIRQLVEASDVISSDTFCWTFFYAHVFYTGYFNTNGLVLAIVRLIYIKRGSWLKYDFGELKLIKIASLNIILNAVIPTFLFGSETSSNRSAFNMCMGHTQAFQVVILK